AGGKSGAWSISRDRSATRASPAVPTTADLRRTGVKAAFAPSDERGEDVSVMSDPAPIEPAAPPPVSRITSGAARIPAGIGGGPAVEPYRRLAEVFPDVLSEASLASLLAPIPAPLALLLPSPA